jgi:hypothetical protein
MLHRLVQAQALDSQAVPSDSILLAVATIANQHLATAAAEAMVPQ